MSIISATWANADQTLISVILDAGTSIIPVDPTNSDYANLQDWVSVGNVIQPYPVDVISLAQAQETAIAECIDYANRLTASITDQYPQAEVDSWTMQLIEARLVQAGQIPPAPSLLQNQVTAANNPAITLQTLAAAVITNATAYQQIVSMVQTMRKVAQMQINAATDLNQIPVILSALKEQSDAAAKQYGLIS